MGAYMLPRWGAEDLERERLSLLERVHDPHTVRQLDAIGVGEGWTCLDVGAGGGSVTRLLAERVGDTGSVLATDLDPRLLEPLVSDRVRVMRHDLLAEPLLEDGFDLVHARFLLIHLPSRLDALRRMLAAVRPGGVLAVADVDLTRARLWPPEAAWGRAWSAFLDASVAAGWDPGYGSRLLADVESLGLEDLDATEISTQVTGGAAHALLVALTLERLRTRTLGAGATDEDVDTAQRLLADPERRFRAPATTFVFGRRPG